MIDEIVTNSRISDEFISHEILVAKINELIRAQNAMELAQRPTSDYAAALKVYREYISSGVSTIEHFVTFPSWCEERLHSSTNVA